MSNLAQQYEGQQQQGVIAQSSSSREMEEVKGAIFLAKQFPRNVYQAEQRILDACKRPTLAESAVYQYPRGGTKVSGPSIRLAEVVAQNWGNIDFGIKELEQKPGESQVMAYAWDLETNTRQTKIFSVKHSRKARGSIVKLDDPRDIYEMVANQGARRVRACILGVIPGDIIERSIEQCQKTLAGNSEKPLKDRISEMLKYFKEHYKVTQEMIEEHFGYNVDSFTEVDLVSARQIINSLKDGMSKVEDWFDKDAKKSKQSDLAQSFDEEKQAPKKDEKADKPESKEQKGGKDDKPDTSDIKPDDLPFD